MNGSMAIKYIEPEYAELCFNSINDSTGHILLISNFYLFFLGLLFAKHHFGINFEEKRFQILNLRHFFLSNYKLIHCLVHRL